MKLSRGHAVLRLAFNALLVMLMIAAIALIGAWLIGGVVSDRYRWSQWLADLDPYKDS